MASGKTHEAVALVFLVGGAIAVYKQPWLQSPIERIALVAGLLGGYCFTPDLDVDGESWEEVRHRRIPLFGRAIAVLWRVWWWPYAKAIKHRSVWSHGIIIGTIIRMGYVWLSVWGVCRLAHWSTGLGWLYNGRVLGLSFVTWAIQDAGHWLFDILGTLEATWKGKLRRLLSPW